MVSKLPEEVVALACQALGLERLPLVLTEMQVSQLGIRSAPSLRRDRRKRLKGQLPYVKEGGLVRYPTHLVLERLLADMQG